MSYNQLITGRRSSINTSGIPLTDSDIVCQYGVTIFSEGSCWVGTSNIGFAASTYGLPMISGNSHFLPVRHSSDIYVMAAVSGVSVAWLAI